MAKVHEPPGNPDSITKRLQKDTTTMKKVRALFDFALTDYPETEKHLSASAAIVYSSTFESAVVRVQLSRTSLLTHEDRHALQCFEHERSGSSTESSTTLL